MARRTSTRYRITERSDQIKKHIKHIYENFEVIAALAGVESDYINNNMPIMISFLQEYEKSFDRFSEGL